MQSSLDFTGEPIVVLVVLALTSVMSAAGIAGMWIVFEKAGIAGWKSLIPVYNAYLLVKLAGRQWWWLLLMFLVIPAFIVAIDIAKRFGRSPAFGVVGLGLFSFVGYTLLALSDDRYQAPVKTA